MDTTSTRSRLHRSLLASAAAALLALASTSALAADDTVAPPTSIGDAPLAPGQYEWTPDVATSGPVTIIVSLPAQEVHVYRGDVRIGRSTISSGRPGHDTPAGTFEILEKDRMHHSNKYDNAPMPYMQRLTWDGVALHAGTLPGYPASHGCVRLPMAFAEQLFQVTEKGGRVIVADETTASQAVLYPGDRIPVDPWTGIERDAAGTRVADGSDATEPASGAALVGSGGPVLAGK